MLKIKKSRRESMQEKLMKNQKNVFCILNKPLTPEELENITEKIKEIVSSENFVDNPIEKIIDKNQYNMLEEERKFKYILDLSAIITSVQEK